MSKLEAIISRKRPSSPSGQSVSPSKRQTHNAVLAAAAAASLVSKNGLISDSTSTGVDSFLLRQQYLMSRLSPSLAAVISGVNVSAANRSPSTPNGGQHQAGSSEESEPGTPVNFVYGIPRPAPTSQRTAPVHIDVGGMNYTSTLDTLTKYPESRLAKLFNGTIPVVLDSFKQAYFLDRDGPSFGHILNFLRNGELTLPEDFQALDTLETEARYFALDEMVQSINQYRQRRSSLPNCVNMRSHGSSTRPSMVFLYLERDDNPKEESETGETIYLTGPVHILKGLFPEFVLRREIKDNDISVDEYIVERGKLEKVMSGTEALRRFAEKGYTVFSTCAIQSPESKRHTVEYAMLSKGK